MNSNAEALDSCLLDVVTNKEIIQRRHYFILNQLQGMVKDVEKAYQSHFSNELLVSLSSSLVDGTICEIVRGLGEIQHIAERNLFNERQKILTEYNARKESLIKTHKEGELVCENRLHHLPIVKEANRRELEKHDKLMNDELRRFDLKVINEFDQKVVEQQDTMRKAGVPGFQVTRNSFELKIQMYILKFIQRMSLIQLPT